MEWVYFFLFLGALICFVVAALGAPRRWGQVALLGFAIWVLVYVITWFRAASGV